MGRYVMWITIMVTLQFSAVLCRNPFQEYFYNKYHHKGHSTTASISSSTSDTSSEEITASSLSDDVSLKYLLHSSTEGSSLKHLLHSSTVDHGATVDRNMTILQYGDRSEEETYVYYYNLRFGLIAGAIVIIVGACCVAICIRVIKQRKSVRPGFVISDPQPRAPELRPQQTVISQQHQQPLISQPYPNRYTEELHQFLPPQYQTQKVQQEFPPQYQTQPVQQEFPPQYQTQPVQQELSPLQTPYQHSPTEQQPHNPPEAPPPYDFPTKF